VSVLICCCGVIVAQLFFYGGFTILALENWCEEEAMPQEGKLSELFCAMLCKTVVHNDTRTHEWFLKISVGLGWLSFCAFVQV